MEIPWLSEKQILSTLFVEGGMDRAAFVDSYPLQARQKISIWS